MWCPEVHSSKHKISYSTQNAIIHSLFSLTFTFLNLYVQIFCLHVYMCTMCMSGTRGSRKRVSHLLELELLMVLSHHVGAENRALVLCKSSKFSSWLVLRFRRWVVVWVHFFKNSFGCNPMCARQESELRASSCDNCGSSLSVLLPSFIVLPAVVLVTAYPAGSHLPKGDTVVKASTYW